MQTVLKQEAHLRKADGKKLDTYANFMKSQSFDSPKKKWSCVPADVIKCNLRTGKRG
jgi:hypothetical protein